MLSIKKEQPWPKPLFEDCFFYHSYTFPNGTSVVGDWDIRGIFDQYIGGYPLKGKAVMDVGTASGFLAFSAEQLGARVSAVDVASLEQQDRVPFAGTGAYKDKLTWAKVEDAGLIRAKNSFWYAWHEMNSNVEVYYCSLTQLGRNTAVVDVVVAGALVVHLADPVTAIGIFAKLAREAVILCHTPVDILDSCQMRPVIPWNNPDHDYVWWLLSSGLYQNIFDNLGFDVEFVPSFNIQRLHAGRPTMEVEPVTVPGYTIMARRRTGSSAASTAERG